MYGSLRLPSSIPAGGCSVVLDNPLPNHFTLLQLQELIVFKSRFRMWRLQKDWYKSTSIFNILSHNLRGGKVYLAGAKSRDLSFSHLGATQGSSSVILSQFQVSSILFLRAKRNLDACIVGCLIGALLHTFSPLPLSNSSYKLDLVISLSHRPK